MKIQLTNEVRKWSLYGGLLTAIFYVALTLNSEPAYAVDVCTTQECDAVGIHCTGLCIPYGGPHDTFFTCNSPTYGEVTCDCNLGKHAFPCS
jgi:hypothetical protein